MHTYTPVNLTVDVTGEKEDLLTLLADQRGMLKVTVRNLSQEDARKQTTASDLTLGALLKHVAHGEAQCCKVIEERDENSVFDMSSAAEEYVFTADDSLAYWLAEYDRAAARFEGIIAAAESLDEMIPQPTAPWAPEREWNSLRTMIANRLRETAHHCGHADIIREALDGQTTMAAISEGQSWADNFDWEQ